MRLRTQHVYPTDPETVFGMLTDEAFLRAMLEARGETDVDVVECAETSDGFRIVTRRTVALEIPGFAKRFLNPTNTVTQTDVWARPSPEGVREGSWRASAKGVPVTMAGTMTLKPAPDGCVEDIEGEIASSVPVVGGRVAAFIGGAVERNLDQEQEFARSWLSGRPG